MPALTDREQELLSLAARGYNHREMSRALGIAPQTARHILQASREKLKARNTAHAVAIALTNHIVTLEEKPL